MSSTRLCYCYKKAAFLYQCLVRLYHIHYGCKQVCIKKEFTLIFLFTLALCNIYAQADSALQQLQTLPKKYISTVEKKIDTYSSRITGKTEKTLFKLARWENKIKNLLQKTSPSSVEKLFGNNQLSFNTLLEKIKTGKDFAKNYAAPYNSYLDNLKTNLQYLQEQKDNLNNKYLKPLSEATQKINELEDAVKNSEAIETFIRERKNRLIDESIQFIGRSKYLKKINKEAYFYVESLQNFKNVFSDPAKAEEAALKILTSIPAFKKFVQKNSQLAGLFAMPVSFPGIPGAGNMPVVGGLASRASLQQYAQDNMPAINAASLRGFIQAKLPDMKAELQQLQEKINGKEGMDNKNLPDFTPNSQHSKSFFKRIYFGTDMQFGKSINFLPATTNISLKMGYKINDKSSAGAGLNYLAGMGNGWKKIKITHQGLGFKTFLKWKLNKSLDVQGGAEWNYMLQFKNIDQLRDVSAWQQSALLGLCKNYAAGKKIKGNFQILFDFLYNKKNPVAQPFVFRFGYDFLKK